MLRSRREGPPEPGGAREHEKERPCATMRDHQHGFRQRRLREQTSKFPPDVCDDAHRCGSSVSGHGNAWTTRGTGAMRDETLSKEYFSSMDGSRHRDHSTCIIAYICRAVCPMKGTFRRWPVRRACSAGAVCRRAQKTALRDESRGPPCPNSILSAP